LEHSEGVLKMTQRKSKAPITPGKKNRGILCAGRRTKRKGQRRRGTTYEAVETGPPWDKRKKGPKMAERGPSKANKDHHAGKAKPTRMGRAKKEKAQNVRKKKRTCPWDLCSPNITKEGVGGQKKEPAARWYRAA